MDGNRTVGSRIRGAHKWSGRLWAVLLLAAVFPISSGASTVFQGNLRTTFYSFESREADGELGTRLDWLQGVRLNVLRLGLTPLSLHTSLTFRDALTGEGPDSRTRLYNGYLKYAPRRSYGGLRGDIRAGRHWVTGGVGTGVVDGGSIRLSRNRWGEVLAYYGSLGIEKMDGVYFQSLDESRRFGGRARFHREFGAFDPVISFSYEKTHRNDRLDSERIGVYGDVRLPKTVRLYGDWRYDRLAARTVGVTGGAEFAPPVRRMRTWVEYRRSHPSFPASSIFWSFNAEPVDALRGGVRMRAWRSIDAVVDGDLVLFDGDDSEKGLRLLAGHGGLLVGWRLHRSYGGDITGLVVSGHRAFGPRLSVDADFNVARYTFGEEEEREEDRSQHVIALRYRLRDTVTLTGRFEGVTNEDFDYDARFLGTIQWRFRSVMGGEEGRS